MCEMDRIFHCTISTPNFTVVPASHKLPTLNFWCLSCERPWALVRDNTVLNLCYDSHFISVPSCTNHCLVLHIISQVVIAITWQLLPLPLLAEWWALRPFMSCSIEQKGSTTHAQCNNTNDKCQKQSRMCFCLGLQHYLSLGKLDLLFRISAHFLWDLLPQLSWKQWHAHF